MQEFIHNNITEDKVNQFDKEYLEKLHILIPLILTQDVLTSRLEHEKELQRLKEEEQKLHVEHTKQANKILDIQLIKAQEAMRPYQLHGASIGYDSSEQKYFCRLMEIDPDLDDVVICAYGKSPQEACDNFDSLWIGKGYA